MRPAVLIILDGWGLAEPGPGNAVALADTPVFDALWDRWPHTTMTAWGPAVGLPEGQMGNSEVGHLNLGAGTIVKQDLLRIDEAIEDGSFFENEVLRAACETERLHLLGLVSAGGVHASTEHLKALVKLAAGQAVRDIAIHAFTDGRDTNPDSGAGYLAELEADLPETARVASVIGRYYAMDRDRRWDRTELARKALVDGEADLHAESGETAVRAAYQRGETDEFIRPTLVGEEGRIRPGDGVIFFNFRPDRARQLTETLAKGVPDLRITTLTRYREDWNHPVAFAEERPAVTLASTLASRGLSQLHVAETEKYAHVTYFFNGGEEEPYEGEERCLVDSPRDVPTYDHKPEMSAPEATDAFVERWSANDYYAFGIINYANPDMVGHTGVIEAAVKAVETVDECLGRLVETVSERGGVCLITADHGNADNMLEPDGSPNTAHSMNPVPVIVTADDGPLREGGILADVAPTLLALMGSDPSPEMTGENLITGD